MQPPFLLLSFATAVVTAPCAMPWCRCQWCCHTFLLIHSPPLLSPLSLLHFSMVKLMASPPVDCYMHCSCCYHLLCCGPQPDFIVLDLQITLTVVVYGASFTGCALLLKKTKPKNSSLTTAMTSPLVPSVMATPKNKSINHKPPFWPTWIQSRAWGWGVDYDKSFRRWFPMGTARKQSITWWVPPQNRLKHSAIPPGAEYC